LFHRTTNADGSARDFHFLDYFGGEEYELVMPFFFKHVASDGARTRAIPFLLTAHRTGDRLDKRAFQLWPIGYQRASDDGHRSVRNEVSRAPSVMGPKRQLRGVWRASVAAG